MPPPKEAGVLHQHALLLHLPDKSSSKISCLHTAAITPRITRPILPSPAAHYFPSPLVSTLAIRRSLVSRVFISRFSTSNIYKHASFTDSLCVCLSVSYFFEIFMRKRKPCASISVETGLNNKYGTKKKTSILARALFYSSIVV